MVARPQLRAGSFLRKPFRTNSVNFPVVFPAIFVLLENFYHPNPKLGGHLSAISFADKGAHTWICNKNRPTGGQQYLPACF